MRPLGPVFRCLLVFSIKRTLCILPHFNMSSCANEDYQKDWNCIVNNDNSLISAAIASSVPVPGHVNLFRAPMLLP